MRSDYMCMSTLMTYLYSASPSRIMKSIWNMYSRSSIVKTESLRWVSSRGGVVRCGLRSQRARWSHKGEMTRGWLRVSPRERERERERECVCVCVCGEMEQNRMAPREPLEQYWTIGNETMRRKGGKTRTQNRWHL